MRAIINYVRSCFCKHDWVKIHEFRYQFDDQNGWRTYQCKRCGRIKKVKVRGEGF